MKRTKEQKRQAAAIAAIAAKTDADSGAQRRSSWMVSSLCISTIGSPSMESLRLEAVFH
jgi:hypothetical protein